MAVWFKPKNVGAAYSCRMATRILYWFMDQSRYPKCLSQLSRECFHVFCFNPKVHQTIPAVYNLNNIIIIVLILISINVIYNEIVSMQMIV
jgi:hypothetical protein